MSDYRFAGKYIIKADVRCITGLHIGGTDEGFEIGGIDNPVIKDPTTGSFCKSDKLSEFY